MIQHLPIFVVLCVVALVYGSVKLVTYLQQKRLLDKIPTVTFPDGSLTRERLLTDFKQLGEIAYNEYTKQNRLCKVPHPLGGWRVVLPEQYLKETKLVGGADGLSLKHALADILAIRYTGNPDRAAYTAKVLRVQVTKRLDPLVDVMIKGVNDYMDNNLPAVGEDWKSVQLHGMFLASVARITVGVFCGEELARDEEWCSAVPNFATDGWGGAMDVKGIPPYLRRFTAGKLPKVQRMAAHKALARKKLRPIYDARKAIINDPDSKTAPDDVFQSMLSSAGPEVDFEAFVQSIMRIMMASVHTTAGMISLALANLLYRPQYIPELTQELREILLSGDEIKRSTFDELHKMDSMIKESARFNPISVLQSNRKVIGKPFVFSDGTVMPAGTTTVAPSWPVLQDPDHYEDPKSYKPFRFTGAADEKRWQLANATEESLNFGYGSQACPGRWFASQEMKLMVAKLLLDFDIKWDKEKNGTQAPMADYVENSQASAPTKWHMLVRRKAKGETAFPHE